ncbi:MAG: carbon monoxide dehydrogenase [Candidatus Handelsmanbacteria bacterium RIFCSPLOWO2_12_FULL_64_10]|uniref:Carbon monoxide dehydrogenase n=1 Tax=Handelsmanbacteria sp. (strain RIFCSPLOWO2_12_FULL_64_10) TaxID=1817868 RepID=A0A1F6D651_HANXR|nr:MAG: carbon monoxide dehydrogenase [Candidatus Handelsmanbacteria bacterium RIFCSPLOWO2_12_FULL_64_10]
MIPSAFDYYAPKTLARAAALLKQHRRKDARLLAGGHSLLPLMKLRLAAPGVVIDLGRIPGLNAIQESKGKVSIGAMATHYEIESSDLLRQRCPLLPETAGAIGDAQVRNRGTLGGSLAHADPASDWPAAILALDAELEVQGPSRRRTIKAVSFFVDLLTTALRPSEILTRVRVPVAPERSGSAYVKMRQAASGFAIVGVAAQVTLDPDGRCAAVAVGVTGASKMAFRASATEEALRGKRPGEAAIRAAARLAAEGIDEFQEDIHASADYRKHLTQVLTRRALTKAVERVG